MHIFRLEMFGLLLQYHCPELNSRLQDVGIRPDLYATRCAAVLRAHVPLPVCYTFPLPPYIPDLIALTRAAGS